MFYLFMSINQYIYISTEIQLDTCISILPHLNPVLPSFRESTYKSNKFVMYYIVVSHS